MNDRGMPMGKSITKVRALQLSFVAIASVVVAEGIIGLTTNSLAILSDAAHALLDTVTTLILLITTQLSMKPPDEEHLYGHGKIEPIGGLVGGVALIGLAAYLFYEAAARIYAITYFPGSGVVVHDAIGFAAVGYTLAVDFFRIGTLWGREEDSVTIRASFYHALSDLASTLIALVGFGLTYFQADDRIDASASIVLGLLLVYLTIGLIRTSSAELSDQIPRGVVAEIRREITGTKGVQMCKELKVRKVGTQTFVETTICVPSSMELSEAHDVASKIENNINRLYGDSSVTVHIEPSGAGEPIERYIEGLAKSIAGVKGVHNLTRVYFEGKLYITLHALVDPQLSIEQAHQIAEQIEANLTGQISNIGNVTVHIEPSALKMRREFAIKDVDVRRVISQIVKTHRSIRSLKRVVTYISDGILYINVDCLLDKSVSVEAMHDTVSHVEAEIKKAFKEAVVTIHAEPSPQKSHPSKN
jgi:cation diffusion facilitator family transporter